jgi:hypothetical protein
MVLVSVKRCFYRAKKLLAIEWLIEKGKGSARQSAMKGTFILVGSHKDERQERICGSCTTLQLPAIYPGHANIRDQTAGCVECSALKNLRARAEEADIKARRDKQAFQRLPDARIIVYNDDIP